MSLQINQLPVNGSETLSNGKKAQAEPGFDAFLLNVGQQIPTQFGKVSGAVSDNEQEESLKGPQTQLPGASTQDALLLMQLQSNQAKEALANTNGRTETTSPLHLSAADNINAVIVKTTSVTDLTQFGFVEKNMSALALSEANLESIFAKPLQQSDGQLSPQISLLSSVAELLNPQNNFLSQLPENVPDMKLLPLTMVFSGSQNQVVNEQPSLNVAAQSLVEALAEVTSAQHQFDSLSSVVKPDVSQPASALSAQALTVDSATMVTPVSLANNGSHQLGNNQIDISLVMWSSVATGKLSQIYSTNASGQFDVTSANQVINDRPREVPLAMGVEGRLQQLQTNTINQQNTFTASLINHDKVQQQTLEKRHATAAAKQHSALFQSMVLPHKVTYSEQLQKMWVRDYFLSPAQTEQLINTLSRGFEGNGNLQTLVLNGQTVYQSHNAHQHKGGR